MRLNGGNGMTGALLAAALGDVLDEWRVTGYYPPAAVMCAAVHPFDPATLCGRLDGHKGCHVADGIDIWNDLDQEDHR